MSGFYRKNSSSNSSNLAGISIKSLGFIVGYSNFKGSLSMLEKLHCFVFVYYKAPSGDERNILEVSELSCYMLLIGIVSSPNYVILAFNSQLFFCDRAVYLFFL